MIRMLAIALIVILTGCKKDEPVTTTSELSCEDGPSELYERKIAPLVDPNRPSSCQKCHLPDVKLVKFVSSDPCVSMACMVEERLVNLTTPADSQILEFIKKGHEEPDTEEVTGDMVDEEYQGFLDWIEYASRCPDSCPKIDDPCETGQVSNNTADVGVGDLGCQAFCEPPPELTAENYGCDDTELTRAFYDHIFPEHERCEHCHSPAGALADLEGSENWLSPAPTLFGAGETIAALEAIPDAINYADPSQSNVLRKPLDESQGGVEHGGGTKYSGPDDTLFLAFQSWIEFKNQCTVEQ